MESEEGSQEQGSGKKEREAAFRDRKNKIDIDQGVLFTAPLSESVAPDAAARWILKAVMELDRSLFGKPSQGGSTYDPRLMLGLWLLAIHDGLRSSRQIERFARSDAQYIFLLAGHSPDHSTICRFRRNLGDVLPKLLGRTVDKAKELGLVDMKVAAIDGTRMSGNVDHWKRNLSKVRLEEEDEPSPPSDPDARIQKTHKGFVVGYNGQAIIDTSSGFVIGAGLSNSCTDQNQLEEALHSCLEMTGELPETLLADGGYSTVMNATALDALGVVGYIPAHHQTKWSLDEKGELCCSCGSKDHRQQHDLRKGIKCVRYRCKACSSSLCVPVDASIPAWLGMIERSSSHEGRAMQRERRHIERLFSLTKHRYGLPRFTLRGLGGAKIQWLLALLMVNLSYLAARTAILGLFCSRFANLSSSPARTPLSCLAA